VYGSTRDSVWLELSRGVGAGNSAASSVQPTMADRVRKLLDQVVDEQLDGISPADAMKEIMRFAESDIPLRQMLGKATSESEFKLSGKLSVGAWIQAIEDSDPNLRVVIRDYGLLLTTKDKIPDGAVRVADFWKMKDAKPKDEPNKK